MQVQIRRISTSSAFLVGMALYGMIGFLVGIVLVVVAGIEVPAGTEPSFVEQLGIWAIVVVPLVFGVSAGLLTATAAALYNAVTSVVGGIRVELRTARPKRRRDPAKEEPAGTTTGTAAVAADSGSTAVPAIASEAPVATAPPVATEPSAAAGPVNGASASSPDIVENVERAGTV